MRGPKPIYHKINDRTGLVACGKDPNEVPITTEWKRTNCPDCRKIAKQKVVHIYRERARRKLHPLFGISAIYNNTQRSVAEDMDKRFGKRKRQPINYGDTFKIVQDID